MSGALHGATAAITKPAITVVNTYGGSQLSNGVTTVTLTGLQVGDFLVAAGGSTQLADPTYTAGWAKATSASANISGGGDRGFVIVTKRATSTSETITFTGTGTSSFIYSSAIALRNASLIGGTATYATTSNGTALPLPDSLSLSGLGGRSAVLCFSYVSTATANSFGYTTSNGVTYGLNQTSWSSGRTLTASTATGHITAIVEVLP